MASTLKTVRSSLTYANVTATLALCVALGGTSYAAVAISGGDVKNNSLTGADLKSNSVPGKDVKDDTITGSDVNESTLGEVPSAMNSGTAGNAGLLDNKDSTAFLGATAKAADADLLDGLNSAAFLQIGAAADGALAGTYPNPTLDPITGGQLASNTITEAQIADATEATWTSGGATQVVVDTSVNDLTSGMEATEGASCPTGSVVAGAFGVLISAPGEVVAAAQLDTAGEVDGALGDTAQGSVLPITNGGDSVRVRVQNLSASPRDMGIILTCVQE